MIYIFLADAILLLHAAFVAFVMFGGILSLRVRRILWLHLPALLWGVAVEWADWVCPLTPLENYLRVRGGEGGHAGGFVEYWLSKILYPQHLTLPLRYALGLALVALNAAVYAYLIAARRNAKSRGPRRDG